MRRLLSLIGVAVVVTCASPVSRAQAPVAPVAPGPVFEVASVKQSHPDPGNLMSMVPMAMPSAGGRFTATNMPLRVLVRTAYEVQDFQIDGGPSWQLSARFDIHAKAEDGFTGGMREMLPMLKALLADRFKLKVHMEKRDLPISALVIARSDGKLGPDIKPSTADCPSPEAQQQKLADAVARGSMQSVMAQMQNGTCTVAPIMPARGAAMTFGLRASGQPLSQLTQLLTQATGRTVEDRTGLKGLYDWTLSFDPQALMGLAGQLGLALPAGAQIPATDSPSLLTAIQEQLGLKLQTERGPVDVLVIDAAEMPTVD